jgi:hypothetical protein
MSNSLRELLFVVFIVLIPTVPVTILAWFLLGRRNRRGAGAEIESGRSSATPFAVISVVGSAIALAAITALLLVVAVRALAA